MGISVGSRLPPRMILHYSLDATCGDGVSGHHVLVMSTDTGISSLGMTGLAL